MSLRDRPFLDLKVPLIWTAGIATAIAIIAGGALLLGDRRQVAQDQAYDAVKSMVDTVAAPVSGALAVPGPWVRGSMDNARAYMNAGSQNESLRAQVTTLRGWRDRAVAAENENRRLRSLLGLRTDPPIAMVTARVITDARGPFANTRLADAGRERGLVVGNPVMSEHGLIGRLIGVGQGVSRVLLLTDIASRTPVLIERTNARAILAGDGGPNPKLSYVRGQYPVKEGDVVLTSGDGGVFPRGLPVGQAVQGLDGNWRVRLDSDAAPIDYVRILLFTDFSQLVDQKDLSASVVPPLPVRDAADVAAHAVAPAAMPPTPASAAPAPAKPISPVKKRRWRRTITSPPAAPDIGAAP